MVVIKKHLFIIILVSLSLSAFAQEIKTNHIVIIDNTGSMRGRPQGSGNLDIWNEVKSEIIDYIRNVEPGNTITLYSFDEAISKPSVFDINVASDKDKAINYVNSLRANGVTTCLYSALNEALGDLQSESSERKLIYIFTDFVEACPDENYTIDEIKNEFNTVRSRDIAHLYYVSLGKSVPDDIRRFADGDKDVYAITKMPNQEDIFPRITIAEKNLRVDFSKTPSVVVTLSVEFADSLYNKNINFKLDRANKSIHLISETVLLDAEEIVLEFLIDKTFFDESSIKSVGDLFISTEELANITPRKLPITFIHPIKRKSTITIR